MRVKTAKEYMTGRMGIECLGKGKDMVLTAIKYKTSRLNDLNRKARLPGELGSQLGTQINMEPKRPMTIRGACKNFIIARVNLKNGESR